MLCNLFIKANLFLTCKYFYCIYKMAKKLCKNKPYLLIHYNLPRSEMSAGR